MSHALHVPSAATAELVLLVLGALIGVWLLVGLAFAGARSWRHRAAASDVYPGSAAHLAALSNPQSSPAAWREHRPTHLTALPEAVPTTAEWRAMSTAQQAEWDAERLHAERARAARAEALDLRRRALTHARFDPEATPKAG
ncbi:hypothetical protein [Streptomyces finlayi]|uniref:hypothetical protein n=1 Tax=Streptomyces finlayi TaxID=67296 RepID=UPI0016791F9A|nr:hypothetical protein [Streptomyces finlayi]